MWLSDISIKRPVFGSVISLLLLIFGIVAFNQLPLREYPNIDAPIVSIDTKYPGANSTIMENRITRIIEDSVAGISGLRFVSSSSQDGRSAVTLEFYADVDIDAAANDVRDKVSRVIDNLPEGAENPQIEKVDADADVIMWLNLVSSELSTLELTDYAQRYLVDQFSTLPGVARVRLGGSLEYAMRVWLDPDRLTAKGLSVEDVQQALRAENVELPAGFIESKDRYFTVRVERNYRTVQDFQQLVIKKGNDNYLVRLADVATIEIGPREHRNLFRGNTLPMVGFGIIKQSTANTIDVARAANEKARELNKSLPNGISFKESYDSSVFIESAINEVYSTLIIAGILVVLVIWVFLKNLRATLVPAVTVPLSLIASFTVLLAMGYSINIITLLALVLAVGLVVDDAIIVVENIINHLDAGESPLVAAFRGTREVGFAVIATTLILVSVFIPITFLQGQAGRLFAEFAVSLAAAVCFSSVVALSLSPVIATKVLKQKTVHHHASLPSPKLHRWVSLFTLKPWIGVLLLFATMAFALILYFFIPGEFAPKEDRGVFFATIRAPEGSSFEYTTEQVLEIEKRLMPLIESGEVTRLLIRSPRSFSVPDYSEGLAILVLSHWDSGRRDAWTIMEDVKKRVADLPSVQITPIMRAGLGGGLSKPLQFAIGGPDYLTLAEWSETLSNAVKNNPKIVGFDSDFDETKPIFSILINRERAADLGVSVTDISSSLETLLGSREVTTFSEKGEDYSVMLQAQEGFAQSPSALLDIDVASRDGSLIPLHQLIEVQEYAEPKSLNRYNRLRSISFDANLAEGYSLKDALEYIQSVVREQLPAEAQLSFKGQSLEYFESHQSTLWVFLLSLSVVFLVLAAQFESFILPIAIITNIPLALLGAFGALLMLGGTLNIYTQIAIIMLIGLSAKNGILIVEFINQKRDQGMDFQTAIIQGTMMRFRPIAMTALTTVFGALPMIFSSGAGSETRLAIGTVIFGGVLAGSILTFFVTPSLYALLGRNTQSPEANARRLEADLKLNEKPGVTH